VILLALVLIGALSVGHICQGVAVMLLNRRVLYLEARLSVGQCPSVHEHRMVGRVQCEKLAGHRDWHFGHSAGGAGVSWRPSTQPPPGVAESE